MTKMTADQIAARKNAAAQEAVAQIVDNSARAKNSALLEAAAAYENVKAGRSTGDLTEAMAAIAAYFYEPGMVWDASERCEVSGNQLAYVQRDVLNGICWTLHTKLFRAEDNLDKAKARAKRAAHMASAGDEISLGEISRALDWCERINLQVMALAESIVHAEAMHLAVTGSAFVAPRRKADEPKIDPKKADIEARLAALGIVNTAPADLQTDGVATDEGEADLMAG